MTTRPDARYAGYRYPAKIITTAVWLYFRFPLSLRMVEELLAARGITVSHETVRQWARKCGPEIATRLRRRAPRRDTKAAKRLLRKLLKTQGRAPRVLVTDKLKSYAATKRELAMGGEHRQHKGLNNRAENSHQPTRRREWQRKRFKDPAQVQRFLSIHDPIANLFHLHRAHRPAADYRKARTQAFQIWATVAGVSLAA